MHAKISLHRQVRWRFVKVPATGMRGFPPLPFSQLAELAAPCKSKSVLAYPKCFPCESVLSWPSHAVDIISNGGCLQRNCGKNARKLTGILVLFLVGSSLVQISLEILWFLERNFELTKPLVRYKRCWFIHGKDHTGILLLYRLPAVIMLQLCYMSG